MDPEISIRVVDSIEDVEQVEDLQRVVWPGDDTEVVPLHLLVTVAHNGGVLLGAFHGERLVGFVFGFLGTDAGSPDRVAMARLKHCSHQLGVHPDYRARGVALMLKLAQREVVLEQGIRLATWTYDPLLSRNAHLNIRRLGTICRSYLRNVYGELRDDLNRGLPTDRFQVEWWVTSPRVTARLDGSRRLLDLDQYMSGGARLLNPASIAGGGFPHPADLLLKPEGTFLLVEIPSDFMAIRDADAGLALAWRMQSRALFEEAFAAGYMVTDFVHVASEEGRRSYYLLSYGEAKLG
jgi:predicted GNAT superfamily acetyltransferase